MSCSMTGEAALEEEGELDLKAFFSLSLKTILAAFVRELVRCGALVETAESVTLQGCRTVGSKIQGSGMEDQVARRDVIERFSRYRVAGSLIVRIAESV